MIGEIFFIEIINFVPLIFLSNSRYSPNPNLLYVRVLRVENFVTYLFNKPIKKDLF